MRGCDPKKVLVGAAEIIDWVAALTLLGVERIDAGTAAGTIGSLLKYREDLDTARERSADWLAGTG